MDVSTTRPLASLDATNPIETSGSLEVPGRARLFAPPTGGFFSVASDDQLTITRYDLTANGGFEQTGEVSFAQTGVSFFSYSNVFLSERKAYYFDESQGQLVVWDPEAMVVVSTVALPMLSKELVAGGSTTAMPLPRPELVRGNRVYVPVAWADWDNEVWSDRTGLLVVDTATDRVVELIEDDRCMAAVDVVMDSNGDAYFGTWDYAVQFNATTRGGERPACVLRLAADADGLIPTVLRDARRGLALGLQCDSASQRRHRPALRPHPAQRVGYHF